MADTKIFKNNPIKEALIDIHIDPNLVQSISDLEQFRTALSGFDGDKKTLHLMETKFDLKAQESHTSQIAIEGYQFWSNDKTEVIHCRRDGFAFSRLKPYDEWKNHFPRMIEHWEKYRDTFKPVHVKRIAVRFINQFEIPHNEFELKDYFNSSPDLPVKIEHTIENFVQRLVIKSDSDIYAVITFSSSRPTVPNITPIILDFDIYKNFRIAANSELIVNEFEQLHIFADKLFSSYITEKTEGLIK
ncbi:MAG: hypothetical protein A2Z20_03450 [Bdellovibrionales bacterium RBG_16_40_8]|nr:MAG: hypothetical protein A2Z20_03450 [Bdellovibrionales bacterium RBG_16_40_8]